MIRKKSPSSRLVGRATACCLLLAICSGAGCGGGGSEPDVDTRVGNMDDTSYLTRRARPHGPSASGHVTSMEQFEGRFVWVDYAAPWCGPCRRQAGDIRQLARAYGDRVAFLTIMTSDREPFTDSTQQTAAAWAGQHGLDPDLVVAMGQSTIVIPTHILFSPTGQPLYRTTGYLPASAIRQTLDTRVADWQAWAETGERAPWMRFEESPTPVAVTSAGR